MISRKKAAEKRAPSDVVPSDVAPSDVVPSTLDASGSSGGSSAGSFAIGTPDYLDDWRGWIGTASELAGVVTALLARLGEHSEPRPSERLVRFYVTAGALSKPMRAGREARFGFRQAVEFLAVRVLLADGWPLARIAEFIAASDLSALRALLPPPIAPEQSVAASNEEPGVEPAAAAQISLELSKPPGGRESMMVRESAVGPVSEVGASALAERARSKTAAQSLVERFSSRTSSAPPAPAAAPIVQTPPAPAPPAPPVAAALDALARRQEVRQDIRRLGGDNDALERQAWVRVTIAPGCELHLRPGQLGALDDESIDAALRLVRGALTGESAQKGTLGTQSR